MSKDLFPICAVCDKPVDEIVRDEKFLDTKLTAYCHGQEETVTITHRDWMHMLAAGQTELKLGKAFLTKQLKE